ncbi:hypothetical protein V3W47_18985 [Deinococcus sp. YIM 134068]|uniref:hypothetical protein n=1 Tax=Deinococcus lichenicola TaxID=3118910 RepID=UPI002F9359E7
MITSKTRDLILKTARRLAAQAIEHAASIPGNVSGAQREAVAVDYLAERVAEEVEERDHLLPILGLYMDLLPVNTAQRRAERVILTAFVRQVYAARELQALEQAA